MTRHAVFFFIDWKTHPYQSCLFACRVQSWNTLVAQARCRRAGRERSVTSSVKLDVLSWSTVFFDTHTHLVHLLYAVVESASKNW